MKTLARAQTSCVHLSRPQSTFDPGLYLIFPTTDQKGFIDITMTIVCIIILFMIAIYLITGGCSHSRAPAEGNNRHAGVFSPPEPLGVLRVLLHPALGAVAADPSKLA